MKMRSTFHVWVLVMTVLTFSMPLVTLAQQASVQAEAVAAAEADAEADVQKPLWFALGCFFLPFGVIGGYVYAPPPPASTLLGKSPEYVTFYTDAYQAKVKNIQGRTAIYGCVIGGAACVALQALPFVGCFLPFSRL